MSIKKISTNTEPTTSISGMTYDNILLDIYNLIQDNSTYKENWTDFISSDGGRMVAELYAYVGEQLANRVDQIGNELFVDTASDKAALIRLLKLTGYKLPFPSSASLELSISTTSAVKIEDEEISSGITDGTNYLNPTSLSFKKITSNSIPFELINYNESTGSYDYITPVTISLPSSTAVKAYQGETHYLSHKVTTTAGFTITLANAPVEKGSVSIFWEDKRIVNYAESFVEFQKVENFFTKTAQGSSVPIYKVTNTGNGVCEIEFPNNDDIGVTYPIELNDNLIIMYRTTSGTSGNISTGSFYVEETGMYYNNTSVNITYVNTTAGSGGTDEQNESEIRDSIEDNVRNSRTLITEDDYEFIYKDINEEIGDITVFGEGNTDIDDLTDIYGYYSNPLNVWLLALAKNKDFNDLYDGNEENLTDYVNDIHFVTLEEDERLNEIYQVKSAEKNNEFSLGTIYVNEEEDLDGYMFNSYLKTLTTSLDKFGTQELDILALDSKFVDKANFNIEDYRNKAIFTINDGDFYVKRRYEGETETYTEIGVDIENSVVNEINNEDSYSDLSSFYIIVGKNGDKNVIEISPENTTTYSSSTLAGLFNSQFGDKIYYSVIKDDITVDDEENVLTKIINSDFASTTLNKLVIDDTSKDISVSPTITYQNMLDDLNSNFGSENIYFALKAKTVSTEGTPDCYQLIAVKSSSFTVENGNDGNDILDNFFLTTENPINSTNTTATLSFLDELYGIDSDDKTAISEFNNYDMLTIEDGNFVLKFGDYDSIFIEKNTTTDKIFGFSSSENYYFTYPEKGDILNEVGETSKFFYTFKRKKFTIEGGVFKIRLNSPRDSLDSCFITILGGTNKKIRLGSYYENIEENTNIDASSNIKSLLKRDAINCLYPTKFNTTRRTTNSTIDDYSSNYEVKLTTSKIDNLPYSKIGNSYDEGAKIYFIIKESFSFDDVYADSDDRFFKVKLNGESYSLNEAVKDGTYTIDNETFSIVEDNGYLKLDVSEFQYLDFNTYFLTTLRVALGVKNVSIYSNEDGYYLETVTADAFSSFDLTKSGRYALALLTGYDYGYASNISTAENGIMDVKASYFNYFEIDDYSVSNAILTINCNGLEDYEVIMPFSAADFGLNINNDSNEVSDYLLYSDKRLILKSRNENDFLTISVSIDDTYTLDAWQKTFPALTLDEDGTTASATVINSGDYYISRELEDGQNNYYFNVINPDKFTYGDIYFHMVEDNKSARKIDSSKTTDEYVWENRVSDRKAISVTHIYKRPRFKTFDVSVNVVYSNNLGLTSSVKTSLIAAIKSLIKENYNIYNSILGEAVETENIKNLISTNVSGIKSVTVSYLGQEMKTASTSVSSLKCDVNEKLIPASDTFEKESYLDSNLTIQTSNVQTHGVSVSISTQGF